MANQPSFLEGQGSLSNKPLRQRIAERLQTAIIDGDLRPGQALVEADIAARLGVSRAPVREALQVLVNCKLVETVPYKGTYVRSLTKGDIEEVYSLRAVLEGFAIERVVALADPNAPEVLREICEKMQRAATAGDYKMLLDQDECFHRTLVKLAQHDLLYAAWNDLSMRVRQIMALRNLKVLHIMDIFYNHLPMVRAIEAQERTLAVKLIREHVEAAADLMIDLPSDAPASDA